MTTTDTVRERITAALPDNAHTVSLPFGFNATWTTPAATWKLSYANMRIVTGFGLLGEGLHVRAEVKVSNPDIETMLAILRLHGAIEPEVDPKEHATIRQLAQELTTIDQALIGIGIDIRGAKGVIALATAYRDRLQADDDRGQPSNLLDDARVQLAEAAELMARTKEDVATDDKLDEWRRDRDRWLDLHEASRAPINTAYQSDLDQERYNRNFRQRA